jgi:transcriptional regulator with XRE-family HTH domain
MTRPSATPLDVEIGARLRQARIKCGLTQADLAKAAGISFQQIQKYERGTNRLTLSTLALLRPVLGVEVFELLPSLRQDGSAIPDPLSAQGQSITGLSLAKLFSQMTTHQQASLLEVAKAITTASATVAKRERLKGQS